ncbi:hypothetical protein C1N55_16885 [Lysinibacillus sp. SGAir0095]|nr:hypothetical protein C1N55_16885 [Lysinibacillus sp. SGAir0095]
MKYSTEQANPTEITKLQASFVLMWDFLFSNKILRRIYKMQNRKNTQLGSILFAIFILLAEVAVGLEGIIDRLGHQDDDETRKYIFM